MPGPEPLRLHDLEPETDPDPDAVTIGGAPHPPGAPETGPIDVSGLLATEDRARMAGGAEPNGWFAGPDWDPDRYQLLGPGLAGGEGDIWRARYRGELTSPLPVAVKRLRRPANVGDDWPTPADLRRWEDLRALLLIMRIDHMVSVLDVFVGPPPHPQSLLPAPDAPVTPYVVMEWVSGPTLADELGGVPATAETLQARLNHVEQVAMALAALHSRTVSGGNPSLHRDVKPTNCILAPVRGVVLVDVGTMRRVDDGRDLSGRHTPAYTAPEVLADPMAARDPASDLYSLGALAWFCLTGEHPPHARDPLAPERARTRARAAARNAGVKDPEAFASHLTLLLAHDPGARPTDARGWAERLRALAVVDEPWSRWLVASALLIPMVAIALILLPLVALRDNGGETGKGEQPSGVTRAALPSSVDPSPPPNRDGQPGPPVPPQGDPGPEPGSRPPGGPGAQPGPWPGEPVTTEVAAFARPVNGGEIGRCPMLRGTAALPPDRTLLFAVENLSVGDQIRHVTPIEGWRRPASLEQWQLQPPVGRSSDPLGERYRLELIAAPLAALKNQEPDQERLAIPPDSYVAASIFVTRGSQSEKGCPSRP